MLLIMNEEVARQNEYLYVLMQFAKPESISEHGAFMSDDDILKRYSDTISKKYMQIIKYQEKTLL